MIGSTKEYSTEYYDFCKTSVPQKPGQSDIPKPNGHWVLINIVSNEYTIFFIWAKQIKP